MHSTGWPRSDSLSHAQRILLDRDGDIRRVKEVIHPREAGEHDRYTGDVESGPVSRIPSWHGVTLTEEIAATSFRCEIQETVGTSLHWKYRPIERCGGVFVVCNNRFCVGDLDHRRPRSFACKQ